MATYFDRYKMCIKTKLAVGKNQKLVSGKTTKKFTIIKFPLGRESLETRDEKIKNQQNL
jgi:hypothetical protein